MPTVFTDIEQKILNRVIDNFLDLKDPTTRKELLDEFEAPGAIDKLVSAAVLQQTQGNSYLPSPISFYLCRDPKYKG